MGQPPGYCADRIDENRDFEFQITIEFDTLDYQKYQIEIQTNNSILIKIKLHSKHLNNVKYFICVLSDRSKTKTMLLVAVLT